MLKIILYFKTENYDLVTAFAFTVAAGVIIWIYSLGLLVIPSLIMTGRSPPSVNVDKISKIGNRFSLVVAYTGKNDKCHNDLKNLFTIST